MLEHLLAVPRDHMVEENRGELRIGYSKLDVKSWLLRMPSVEAVRPSCCLSCGAAARPVEGELVVRGHGLRERLLRGPLRADGPPEEIAVACRRYRCRLCSAAVMIVPRGVLRGRLYHAGAIALAMVVWGLRSQTAAEVRSLVSPWRQVGATAAAGWTSLGRWVGEAAAGGLFRGWSATVKRSLRELAGRLSEWLLGHVPPSARHLPVEHQVFAAVDQLR